MEEVKTPEEMALEYAHRTQIFWDGESIDHHIVASKEMAFLAGYQAAKDEYKVAIDVYNDVAKQMLGEAVRIMSPKDQLADADKVMNSSNNSNGWISVKERLPEIADGRFISDDVLWISTYGEMHASCLEKLRSKLWVDWGEAGSLKLDEVTHWMPLPKPPEE